MTPIERSTTVQRADLSVAERSAGGVVVRCGRVLLISPDGHQWRLPKGRLEAGEGAVEAALREVHEETGIVGQIICPLPSIAYSYHRPDGVLVRKRVDFFLMDFVSGREGDHDPREVTAVAWHSFDSALQRLRFQDERQLVAEARRVHRQASDDR